MGPHVMGPDVTGAGATGPVCPSDGQGMRIEALKILSDSRMKHDHA